MNPPRLFRRQHQHLYRAPNLETSLRDDLPLFEGDRAGEFFRARLQLLGRFFQDLVATPRRELRHRLRSAHGGGERRIHIRQTGVGHGIDHRIVVRMHDLDLLAGFNPPTAHAHFHGLFAFITIFIPRLCSSEKNG